MSGSRFRDGVLAALPLTPAPVLFGASFGLLAQEAGFGALAAIVMSATTFAGSAQFAAASILETGGGAAAAIIAAVLLNARYVPLSVSVASIFPGGAARRLVEAQLIGDEGWAISGRSGRFEYPILVGVGLFFYPLWVGGTALGALAGEALGDAQSLGLDAAFPALFLALLVPYLRSRQALRGRARRRRDHARPDPVHAARTPDRRREPRRARRPAQMSDAWLVVVVVGAATVLFKAAGPLFLARRSLPPRALSLVEVLAPVMLAALVVTQAVGGVSGAQIHPGGSTGLGAGSEP